MTSKLTLTIEEKVITTAKKYARKKGKSLSHIVENYLKSISVANDPDSVLSPEVSRLRGVIKLPADFNYKKELGSVLSKKYRK